VVQVLVDSKHVAIGKFNGEVILIDRTNEHQAAVRTHAMINAMVLPASATQLNGSSPMNFDNKYGRN